MKNVTLIVFTTLLLFVVGLSIFQWLYAKEVRRITAGVGIIFPSFVHKLIALTMILPILAALVIGLFILLSF